jgi:hypothetical protein
MNPPQRDGKSVGAEERAHRETGNDIGGWNPARKVSPTFLPSEEREIKNLRRGKKGASGFE